MDVFDTINIPEEEKQKRRQLVASYVGQQEYMFRRIARNERRISRKAKHIKREPQGDIKYCWMMIASWQKRINRVKSGEPLENIVGKKLTKNG